MKMEPRLRHCVTKRRPGPERRRRAGLRPSRDEKVEAEVAGAGALGSGLSVLPLRSAPRLAWPGPARPSRAGCALQLGVGAPSRRGRSGGSAVPTSTGPALSRWRVPQPDSRTLSGAVRPRLPFL